jgi:hypothetical protein
MNITTLIPAYKSKYIPDVLNSLRYQTRPAQRILFSDDSPNGEYRQALLSEEMRPLTTGLNIEVCEGSRTGAYENVKHVVRVWGNSSELVHLMFDDDVIYPEFYERHLVAHASSELSCSISPRWTASEEGDLLAGQSPPAAVTMSPNRILSLDADVMFMTTVAECKNWFGEFSNTVMRGDSCDLLLKPELGGVSYAGLWDLGYFLAASMRSPVGYLQDHLGYFRTGGTGNSANSFGPFVKAGVLGYVALALGGRRVGKLSNAQATHCYTTIASVANHYYSQQADLSEILLALNNLTASVEGAEAQFLAAWANFHLSNGF